MRFRVTRHTAVKPPEGVLSLLSEHIPARREDVIFSRGGSEISARLDRDESVRMTADERIEIGRRAVLEAVGEVCKHSADLDAEWFAVSPAP
jgi:hypothetical protein